jgi:hypothetical protein
MKNKLHILILLIISIGTNAQSLSPTIINATGGSATVNGITYEYSFGEMTMISTFSTPKLIVTQGVLQSKTDTVAIGIHENESSIPAIVVFPNPVAQFISFESEYKTAGKLDYILTDAAGKLILNKQLSISAGKTKETIDVSNLPTGMYFLKVTVSQGKETSVQTSKIQKIN